MLGKLPVLILRMVGQGPTVLAAGAGGGGLDFPLICHFSLRSPSLWETARYRLQFLLFKRAVKPKATN